jgi:hypothetical protein
MAVYHFEPEVRLEEASESALAALLAVRGNRFWGQPFTEPTTCR